MNTFKFVLIPSLFLSLSALGADDLSTLRFANLDACKTYFNQMPNKTVNDNVTSFCKNRIKSAIDLCVDQKTSDYLTQNKMNSLADMIVSEQTNLLSQLNFQCQSEQQRKAIDVSTQQAAQAQQKAAQAAANGSSGSGSGADLAQTGIGLATVGAKIYSDYDKKNAPAVAGNKTISTSVDADAAKNQTAVVPTPRVAATSSVSANSNGANEYSGVDEQIAANTKNNKPLTAAEDAAVTEKINNMPQPNYESNASNEPVDLAAAKDAITKDVAEVKPIDPKLGSAAEDLNKKADGSLFSIDDTEITASADKKNADLIKTINEVIKTKSILAANGASLPYASTVSAITALEAQVTAYLTSKKTCTSTTEKTEFLCIERKSPGAQAAKQLMNIAGPAVALIASAQKTCSSTAKITRLVSTGLTIAKGVCVASQLACDGLCLIPATALSKLATVNLIQINAAINSDFASAAAACNLDPICEADVSKKSATASSAVGLLKTAFAAEAVPTTPGTTPQLQAQCLSYWKDIALFAVQIAGTLAAQGNAQKCADKLASSTAGGNVTVQQYCEKQENLSTDFCKCQANNTAPGCPGAIVAAGTKNVLNDVGANFKSSAGNSAFANGYKPSAPDTTLGNKAVGDLGSSNSNSGALSDPKNAGAQGYAGSSTSGSSSQAVGPQSGSDPSLVKDKSAEKGWSFGSFSSLGKGLSSFLGGSSGSKNSSGTLGTKQLDAIKRQIASEKISNEVSTASGKSNWEKVRNMYLNKEGSFLVGQ